MTDAYLIALGSNLGDRASHLARARASIARRLGPVTAASPAYETEPLGAADALFYNAALIVETRETPEAVLQVLLDIERELGRVRRERWGNRVIDLDLLLWLPARRSPRPEAGHRLVTAPFRSESLEIPHPAMLDRPFVLVPAADVAGTWVHPTTDRTLRDELQERRYALTVVA